MTIPLMLLAVGAVAAGWIGIPPILGGGAHFAEFLRPVVDILNFMERMQRSGVSWPLDNIGIDRIRAGSIPLSQDDGLPVRIGRHSGIVYYTLQ